MLSKFVLQSFVSQVLQDKRLPQSQQEELKDWESDQVKMFNEFKKQFNRKYKDADEEMHRFEVFFQNLEKIQQIKYQDPIQKYSHLTKFQDWTEDEFSAYNRLEVTKADIDRNAKKQQQDMKDLEGIQTPKEWNWVEKGQVTGVKDQGQCGSCWQFQTVQNIEGNHFVRQGMKGLISLSESEIVDCSKSDNGCNGGLPSRQYEDLMKMKMGLELEKDYSYIPEQQQCRQDPTKEKVFLDSYKQISQDEEKMQEQLVKYGPLQIGLNQSNLQFYTGGVSDPWFCSQSGIDHGVTIVGFGTQKVKHWFKTEEVPYWLVKNSWGASWGEKGYFRIRRGKGKCGLNKMVTSQITKVNSSEEILAL